MEKIATLKKHAFLSDTYRFFDLEFSIRSDSKKVLDIFRDIFARFLIEEANGTKSAYYVLTNDGASGNCAVIVDDKMYKIDQPDDLAGYAYMKIMESALSKVLSHCLFHAAALSFNGQGIILPAASKSGKTTLTLELVKRGFKLLSDDISAVSRLDYLLHPFPKRLGILPYTLELCPEAKLDSLKLLPMIGGGKKKLLDIEDFYPGSIGKPCRLRYLIFLGSMQEQSVKMVDEESLYIVVNKVNEELLSDIRDLDRINEVSIHPYKMYPVIKLLINGKRPVLTLVEDVCHRHRVLIFDTSNGREEIPNFTDTPRLEKLSKSIASLKLLRELKGGQRSVILQDLCRGNVSVLLMLIGEILEGVECFYLTPGKLKERADKICDILKDV